MGLVKWIGCFFLTLSLGAEETDSKNQELVKISEAMGHLIGKNLQSLGLSLDIDALVRGMQQASNGNESPLTEEECLEAISHLQEESIAKVAQKNLQEASCFLICNQGKEGVVALEEGKLQYEIVKTGEGGAVLPYSKPLIRYSGKYLNGPQIPTAEEFLDLEEMIPGFKKGLVGMKEGEVRRLYIHPEYGYEEAPSPNALLIFDVELIKADATIDAHAASNESLETITF